MLFHISFLCVFSIIFILFWNNILIFITLWIIMIFIIYVKWVIIINYIINNVILINLFSVDDLNNNLKKYANENTLNKLNKICEKIKYPITMILEKHYVDKVFEIRITTIFLINILRFLEIVLEFLYLKIFMNYRNFLKLIIILF